MITGKKYILIADTFSFKVHREIFVDQIKTLRGWMMMESSRSCAN